nr:PfkB family carbohydrate kinase [Nocardia wallacei]
MEPDTDTAPSEVDRQASGRPRLIVFGSAVADFIVGYREFPGAGDSADAESVRMNPGGKGLNLATQSARLGAAVQLVTAFGRDIPGTQIEEVLGREHIGADWVRIEDEAPTETVVCLLDTAAGDASFLEHTSPGVKLTAADVERAASAIAAADVAVITAEVPDAVIAEVCAMARRNGTRVVLQPAPAPERFSTDTVSMADVLVPNEIEARTLLAAVDDDAATIPAHQLPQRLFQAFGVPTIVVTLGAAGCAVWHDGHTQLYPAHPVDAVVETIGASDSFTATLAVRLESGDSIDAAIRAALSAAAHTIARPGGLTSMPFAADLDAQRHAPWGSAIFSVGPVRMDSARRRVWVVDGDDVIENHLSSNEFALLDILTREPGHAVSRRKIEEAVWGEPLLNRNSLSVLVRRLKNKLRTDGLITAVPGGGYRFGTVRSPPGDAISEGRRDDGFIASEDGGWRFDGRGTVRAEEDAPHDSAPPDDSPEDGLQGRTIGTRPNGDVDQDDVPGSPQAERRTEDDVVFRYVTGPELAELRDSVVDLDRDNWEGGPGRLGLESWTVEAEAWGAVVAEAGGPGGRLVGFCLGQRKQELSGTHLALRKSKTSTANYGVVEPRFEESNVHVTAMVVDQGMRRLGIADAMLNTFLLHRDESQFSVYVGVADKPAIAVVERVGIEDFGEFGHRDRDDEIPYDSRLYRGSRSVEELQGRQRRLAERGFATVDENLVLRRPAGTQAEMAGSARPLGELPGDVTFRYVTGPELTSLALSAVELNRSSGDDDLSRLDVGEWADAAGHWGAMVAVSGGRLVGMCLGRRKQEFPGYSDLRGHEVRGGRHALDPRRPEPNVHITTLLVDENMRGFGIGEALLSTFLLNRQETRFSVLVDPEKDQSAIAIAQQVGGLNLRPLGGGRRTVLYEGPRSEAGLLGRRQRLWASGYTEVDGELVLRRPVETAEQQRKAALRRHPHSHDSVANWARAVRGTQSFKRMDRLIDAPDGTWQDVENGAELSIGQVRALLRNMPGAREWYAALAASFFPELAGPSSQVGLNLRSVRERAGIEPEQLAARLGLSVAELDAWETGLETGWAIDPETGKKVQKYVELSQDKLFWYLRGLASLMPAPAVERARLAAIQGGDGEREGVCLAALRIGAGLEPRFITEKTEWAPGKLERIETGTQSPTMEDVEAYLRALAPGTPCFPEGYRRAGEYLKYLRQKSGASLAKAAEAAKTTTTMMDDHESGRVAASVETVGVYLSNYLDKYSENGVSIDECVAAFPELAAAAARRAAENARPEPESGWGVRRWPEVRSASVVWPRAASPGWVRLHDTAALSDADDLARAIVAGADAFAELGNAHRRTQAFAELAETETDPRVLPLLRRYPKCTEVTTADERIRGTRTFAFREFERRDDRTVDNAPDSTSRYEPDSAVAGWRQPKVTEVLVRLTKPAPGSDWIGVVAGVSTRRDPALWEESLAPEAAPDPEKAQGLIGHAMSVVVGSLRLLGVTTVGVEYGTVQYGDGVEVRTIEGTRSVPLKFENVARSVTMTFTDAPNARFDIRVDPKHGRLIVSSSGGLLLDEQILSPRGALTLELEHAVSEALVHVLVQAVSIHLKHGKVTSKDPRYVRDAKGTLVATWPARVDGAIRQAYDTMLARKPRSYRQQRHFFRRRAEVLRRLEYARGPLALRKERLAALRAESTRFEESIRRHWGPVKIRTPQTLHPEAAPPFSLHYGMALLASSSNALTAPLADSVDYQLRGGTGSLTGSIYLARSRYWVYVNFVYRRNEEDTAPLHFLYQTDGKKEFYSVFLGRLFDTVARLGGSLILGRFGVPINPALLGGMGVRNALKGLLDGVRSAQIKPLYSVPEGLTTQTLAVTGRGEFYNLYIRLRDETSLLARRVKALERGAQDKRALPELIGRLNDMYRTIRAMADLIERYGFGPAALRTGMSPVNSPSNATVRNTGWMSPVGSAGAGALITWALGDPWLGVLGAVWVWWHFVSSAVNRKVSSYTGVERATRTQRNHDYQQKQWDDDVREAIELFDPRLALPAPLADARRKWVGAGPYILKGLFQAIAELPFTFWGALLVPPGAGLAYFFERFLSPITNGVRSFAEEIFDQYKVIKNKEIDDAIALEEGPHDLSGIIDSVAGKVAEARSLLRAAEEIIDPAGYPDFSGAVSPAAVYRELMKKGEGKENSSIVLERFRQVVAANDTPELFDAFMASITKGFAKLEPEQRAGKAAAAFLEWHESRVAAIGKLEMMDRFAARYLPPELRLEALFPEERRTPLDPQYCEFARVVAKLPIVAVDPKNPKSHELMDYTGLLYMSLILAGVRNGVYLPDPDNPEMSRLDTVTLGNFLTIGATVMMQDLELLGRSRDLDALLADSVALRRSESIAKWHGVGVEGVVGLGARSVQDGDIGASNTASKEELHWARNLFPIALGDPVYRGQYVDRLARRLADTREPAVEDRGYGDVSPDPVAEWPGNVGYLSPLIDARIAMSFDSSTDVVPAEADESDDLSTTTGGDDEAERSDERHGTDDLLRRAVFGRVQRVVANGAVAQAITGEVMNRVARDGIVSGGRSSVDDIFAVADIVMVERLREGIRSDHTAYVERDVVGRVLQTMTPAEWESGRLGLTPAARRCLTARFLRGLPVVDAATELRQDPEFLAAFELSAVRRLAELIDAERGGPDQRAAAESARKNDDTDAVAMDRSPSTEYPTVPGETVSRIGSFELDRSAERVTVAGKETPLSPTEFALLSALTQRPGHVVTLDDLERLWQRTVSPKTINFAAIGLRNRLDARTCVVRLEDVGWRFDGLPSDRAIVDANVASDPRMLDRSGVRLSPSARRVWVGDHEIDLTRTEFDLLMTLMAAAGRVLSREEIENEVWGDVSPKPNRLESQVYNLRNKLGEKGNDLIEWADTGYRFSLPTTSPVVRDKPRPTPWTQTSRESSRPSSRVEDPAPRPDTGLPDDGEPDGDGPRFPIGTRPDDDGMSGRDSRTPWSAPAGISAAGDSAVDSALLAERADGAGIDSGEWRAHGGHALDAMSDQVRELLRYTEVGRRVLESLESMRVDERFVYMSSDRSIGGSWNNVEHAATVYTSGNDYVAQALILAHESVHAEFFARNRSVRDPLSMSRAEYVRAMVAEETACFRRSMELAVELRSRGFEIPRGPIEDAYDAAYDKAVARRAKSGLTAARIHEQAHASAIRAAEQVVGSFRWKDGRRNYRLHYQEIWDRARVRMQYGVTQPSWGDAVDAGQPRHYELTPAGAERMRHLVLRHDSDVVAEQQLSRRLSEMAAEYGIAAGATSVLRAHVARDIASLDAELVRTPERRPELRRVQHKLRELSDLADELDKSEASIRSGRLKVMRDIVVADVVDRLTSDLPEAQRISDNAVLLPGTSARLVIVSEPGEHRIVLSDPRVAAAARGARVEYCHVKVHSDGESYVWTTTRPVESRKPPQSAPLYLAETATRRRMERIRAELGSAAVGAWALDVLRDVEIVHTADPAAAGFKPVRRRLVLDIGMSDEQHMAHLVHHAIHVAVARDRETIEFVREQLTLSRESYIDLRTAEETRAHAMEIVASLQLRNAGYAVPEPVGLRAYTEAYYRARAELVENMGLTGKTVPERFLPVLDRISNDAGLAALRPEVESHVVQGERYRDVYGKAWDAARGVRRFAEQVQAARASGERSVQFLHSGTTVPGVRKVELVTFDDDATYVRATLRDSHDAHAAMLSSRLGRAFGLPMPRIVADGHLVYCEPVSPALQAEFARADFGSVGLGLHDALTGSPDGNRVMADRSTQVAWSNQHHAFLATRLSSTTVSRFARRFLRVHADRTVEFIAHDVTTPELEWFRDRLLELRPEFERLGRGDWHDMMLDRFTRITEYARP